jgi:hypothetical protein
VLNRLYNNRLYNNRLYNNRLYNNRLYNNRLYNTRLYNTRLYNNRRYNNRLYDNRLYDNRLYNNRLYNNRLYNNRLYNNRLLYNNRPIRHRQQGSAHSILGGLREGRRAGVLGTCKRPRTVRLPVRVRSPLSAQLPEYCNEMASPWSAHMHLNCRFFWKTRAYLSGLSVLSCLPVANMAQQQIEEAQ